MTLMAQNSKKNQIASTALPLFLEHGIKGTSVDMVVKASGVSKPTVYNHFPDKAALFDFVMQQWLEQQGEPAFRAKTLSGFVKELSKRWLSPEPLRLYQLTIGEGFRCRDAAASFLNQYDGLWRSAAAAWAKQQNIAIKDAEAAINAALVKHLLSSKN